MKSFFVLSLWTQQASALCEAGIEPACAQINSMQELSKALAGVSCVRAKYTQERVTPHLTKPFFSSGIVTIVRGVGVVMTQDKPFKKITAFGDDGVMEDGEFNTLISRTHGQAIIQALSLQLSGIGESFRVSFANVLNSYELKLKPARGGFDGLSAITLAGTCYPQKISVSLVSGESRTIALDDFSFSPFLLTEDELRALQTVAQ